jgi:hypothetical protein
MKSKVFLLRFTLLLKNSYHSIDFDLIYNGIPGSYILLKLLGISTFLSSLAHTDKNAPTGIPTCRYLTPLSVR